METSAVEHSCPIISDIVHGGSDVESDLPEGNGKRERARAQVTGCLQAAAYEPVPSARIEIDVYLWLKVSTGPDLERCCF